MDEKFEMIKDIYLSPNSLTVHAPFSALKKINNTLMRERAYHSQVVMEFYLMCDAIELMKDKWITLPFVTDFLYHALISQRTAEYAIICHHFDVGLIGIKMDDWERLYMLGLCLYSTWQYMNNIAELFEIPALMVTRKDDKFKMARTCQELIERIFVLIQREKVKTTRDKHNLCKRLALCNQNLNSCLIVLKPKLVS